MSFKNKGEVNICLDNLSKGILHPSTCIKRSFKGCHAGRRKVIPGGPMPGLKSTRNGNCMGK